jgi:hypothetical protein
VIARVLQTSPFSPNLAVDQHEVWSTFAGYRQDTGREREAPFHTMTVLETGPITNHITFVTNAAGRLCLGRRKGSGAGVSARPGFYPKLIATIKTCDLPHRVWGSGDGRRVYVGLENGDAVQAIDTVTKPSRRHDSSRSVAAGAGICAERNHL